MIKLAGLGENLEENKKEMLNNILNGKGYDKFLQMVKKQGGDVSCIENTDKFEKANNIIKVSSDKTGIIEQIKADTIAKYVCNLGTGRIRKEDKIDMQAGAVLHKKVGDSVQKGEPIVTIYTNKQVEKIRIEELGIGIK